VYSQKVLPSGCIVALMNLMFTKALISNVEVSLEEEWFYHRYCYEGQNLALRAFEDWDGVSTPLEGYVAYKGRDIFLALEDAERKNRI